MGAGAGSHLAGLHDRRASCSQVCPLLSSSSYRRPASVYSRRSCVRLRAAAGLRVQWASCARRRPAQRPPPAAPRRPPRPSLAPRQRPVLAPRRRICGQRPVLSRPTATLPLSTAGVGSRPSRPTRRMSVATAAAARGPARRPRRRGMTSAPSCSACWSGCRASCRCTPSSRRAAPRHASSSSSSGPSSSARRRQTAAVRQPPPPLPPSRQSRSGSAEAAPLEPGRAAGRLPTWSPLLRAPSAAAAALALALQRAAAAAPSLTEARLPWPRTTLAQTALCRRCRCRPTARCRLSPMAARCRRTRALAPAPPLPPACGRCGALCQRSSRQVPARSRAPAWAAAPPSSRSSMCSAAPLPPWRHSSARRCSATAPLLRAPARSPRGTSSSDCSRPSGGRQSWR